jgi:hypothetical protein
MHLSIDGAWQNEISAAAMAFAGRRRTCADALNKTIRYEHIPILDDPIRKHDCANKYLIDHAQFSSLHASRRRRIAMKPGKVWEPANERLALTKPPSELDRLK